MSIKIAVVYTATTPELIDRVERELNTAVPGATLLRYEDASILTEARENGIVTAFAASRLAGMFTRAILEGADVILNACSSVGEAADSLQDFARYAGVPIVRIDEEMCREAVRTGAKIGVMATLPTTLKPTCNTILRVARELGRRAEVLPVLVENAFGLSGEEFAKRMLESAAPFSGKAEVILFAQGSMAFCERLVAEAFALPVLSSPRFGAKAVCEALKAKGLL